MFFSDILKWPSIWDPRRKRFLDLIESSEKHGEILRCLSFSVDPIKMEDKCQSPSRTNGLHYFMATAITSCWYVKVFSTLMIILKHFTLALVFYIQTSSNMCPFYGYLKCRSSKMSCKSQNVEFKRLKRYIFAYIPNTFSDFTFRS